MLSKGLFVSYIRYGTEHPPKGTSIVVGILITTGVFVIETVYFERLA